MALGFVLSFTGAVVAPRIARGTGDDRPTTLVGVAAPAGPIPPVGLTTSPPDSAAAGEGRPERVPVPRSEQRQPPPRLSPQPPADGRDAADPAVVHDGDRWALFSTQVGFINVPVALSDDLRHWSPPVDALPELPTWAEWGHTWAPGVLRRDNGFVLYFAARSRALGLQCIGAATAGSIEGPYTSQAPEPLVCQPPLGGSIDPQPFLDSDGTAYLLWKADGNATGQTSLLFVQRLRPDGLALAGEAVPLLRGDAEWEWPLIENPALLAADGAYLLLYSGGWWESGGYATGYAVCATPLGPCVKKTTEQPILASAGDQAGTGGASVVIGPAGDHWLAYHAWTAGTIGYESGGARSLRFASLTWDSNQVRTDADADGGIELLRLDYDRAAGSS
jgi:beta-xylosidase